ncbi:MAG TPA: metallophosphoesterase [Methanoregulaceae archaeon]|nr:metallophosphoesterase [Methanoregulaceae archaeon]
MRIGIISDTHDRQRRIEAAVDRLNRADLDLVLHAGDYVSPFVVPWLAALSAPLVGVLGNNDGDHALLAQRFTEYDRFDLRGDFARVEAEGAVIALLHGHQRELLDALVASQGFDYVVRGHSHRAGTERHGRTLVVNPGTVSGILAEHPTFAILDTAAGEVEVLVLR